jgi:uncharacterized coiled-coil DUF342 family protein
MPSTPYYQSNKLSPRSEIREEIIRVHRNIAQTKSNIDSIPKNIRVLENEKEQFCQTAPNDPRIWDVIANYSKAIMNRTNEIVEEKRQLSQYQERLARLETKLDKVEEAAKRARGMLLLSTTPS